MKSAAETRVDEEEVNVVIPPSSAKTEFCSIPPQHPWSSPHQHINAVHREQNHYEQLRGTRTAAAVPEEPLSAVYNSISISEQQRLKMEENRRRALAIQEEKKRKATEGSGQW